MTRWLLLRYIVIGTYVGLATVAGSAWWFMFYKEGPQVSFRQLVKKKKEWREERKGWR